MQCRSPQLLALLKITWLARGLLSSCYTCVPNKILILIFLNDTALQFHQERFTQHLMWGLWLFLQRDIKVDCDIMFFLYNQSNKRVTISTIGRHGDRLLQFCFLLIYWLQTRRSWGHVGTFLCGVVITMSAAHSSESLEKGMWHNPTHPHTSCMHACVMTYCIIMYQPWKRQTSPEVWLVITGTDLTQQIRK